MVEGRNEGWYPGPAQIGGARQWYGTRWTDHVSYGGSVVRDATSVAVVARQEAESNAAIIRGYVDTMVALVRRTPTSALRYLVAPALWLAVGLTVGVAQRPAPAG